MSKKSWKSVMLLAAAGLMAGVASPALAGGDRDHRDRRGYHDGRGEHRHHGVLYLNGRAYQVNGPGAFRDHLYHAFRRAGYRCGWDEGRIRIYVGARRPKVSWRGGCGCPGISFTYSRGYLYVNIGSAYGGGKPHYNDHRGGHYNSPHSKPRPHYQPRHRTQYPSVHVHRGPRTYHGGSWGGSWNGSRGHGSWGNTYRWPSYHYYNGRQYPYGYGSYRRGWDSCR